MIQALPHFPPSQATVASTISARYAALLERLRSATIVGNVARLAGLTKVQMSSRRMTTR
ncbi:MAG: hypothetical protein AB1749_10015 [Pseudomonadota bacterium]